MRGLTVSALLALAGCASDWAVQDSVSELRPVSMATGRLAMRVEPCIDRTGHASRDLSREATDALLGKLRAAGDFDLRDDGRYVLSCDISAFVEGSAFQRWLLPGWGATSSLVAVMVRDSKTGETVAIVRGTATVAAGGLYTVDADRIILASALDDVVRQLRELAAGAAPGK
jgi:hypothetical protein